MYSVPFLIEQDFWLPSPQSAEPCRVLKQPGLVHVYSFGFFRLTDATNEPSYLAAVTGNCPVINPSYSLPISVRVISIQFAPTSSNYCNPRTLHTRSTHAMTTRRATRSPLLSQRRNPGRRQNGRNGIRTSTKERILGEDGGSGDKGRES